MLLELDDSLIDYLEKNSITVEEQNALSNLFHSHLNRIHHIYGSRKIFGFLMDFKNISVDVQKSSKSIFLAYTNFIRGLSVKENKIIIVPSNYKFRREDKYINNLACKKQIMTSKFHVPLNYFNNQFMLERTSLISENSSDIDFYFQLSKGVKKLHKRTSGVIFSRSSGGGGTTFQVIEDKVKDNNIALVVIDSDKIHPNDNYGTTYKNAVKKFNQYKNDWIIGFEVLDVHEKENLIPPTVYKNLNEMPDEIINPWEMLYNHPLHSDLYNFADLKEGISTLNYCDFYEPLFEIKGLISNISGENWGYLNEFIGTKEEFHELNQELKKKNKQDQIKEAKYLLPPLGSKILNDFSLEEIHRRIIKTIDSIQKSKTTDASALRKVTSLKETKKMIETFDSQLNCYHKEYLEQLSNIINEWGYCHNKVTPV